MIYKSGAGYCLNYFSEQKFIHAIGYVADLFDDLRSLSSMEMNWSSMVYSHLILDICKCVCAT